MTKHAFTAPAEAVPSCTNHTSNDQGRSRDVIDARRRTPELGNEFITAVAVTLSPFLTVA